MNSQNQLAMSIRIIRDKTSTQSNLNVHQDIWTLDKHSLWISKNSKNSLIWSELDDIFSQKGVYPILAL